MQKYDVAAFIWPSYTGDEPRSRIFWPEGYGEWQTVRSANAKYEGHLWPRKPLWGYVNEADPFVMEMEIEAAAAHGVNVFIYDWYWYDDRPFLEQCLNNGYLKARNNDKVKFYLMWANHDATSIWDKRTAEMNETIWVGTTTFEQFKTVVRRAIDDYFSHPSYYKIDGKPVYMIYDFRNLIKSFGIEGSKKALDYFREETVKAGFPGLHLQVALRNQNTMNATGIDPVYEGDAVKAVNSLGFDSGSYYQYVQMVKNMGRDYLEILADAEREEKYVEENFNMTYFPHVSVGWDKNPRYNVTFGNVCENNTPENVEKAFRAAKKYIDTHPELPAPLITVNSWNEWTETSYLQPDDLYGYGYLEAIKKVFVDEE